MKRLRKLFGPALALVWILACGGAVSGGLVSRYEFDGTLEDSGPGANHGTFLREDATPAFTADRSGAEGTALALRPGDELELGGGAGLPAAAGRAFTVAFWVRGGPQAGVSLYREKGRAGTGALFALGPERTGTAGRLEITVAAEDGAVLFQALSSAEVFDGRWHHVAWTDAAGGAALYVDGLRDPAEFSYTKPALPLERTILGGSLLEDPERGFEGALDDLRIYDQPLDEFAVQDLLPLPDGCPGRDEGDTRCGVLEVTPADPGREPPLYRLELLGSADASGDPIRYFFEARSDAGDWIVRGPQEEPVTEVELPPGVWNFRAIADDDPLCPDRIPEAICSAGPLDVGCPASGDTHCGRVEIDGPPDRAPGTYTFRVEGSWDDSGDPLFYNFRLENDEGRVLRRGPQPESWIEVPLLDGHWRLEVAVDDDPDCPDEAPDARCTAELTVGCPAEGDTECGELHLDAPGAPAPGLYRAEVLGAGDGSGDPIVYQFRADAADGRFVWREPQAEPVAWFLLDEGEWRVSVTVDDDLFCADTSPAAVCESTVAVIEEPPGLIAAWPLDGTLEDALGRNPAEFPGEPFPSFGADREGEAGGALLLDGEDDCLVVGGGDRLPLSAHRAFTVAFWVRGEPQRGRVLFAEASDRGGAALFALGTSDDAEGARLEVLVRTEDGEELLPRRRSARTVLDGVWHHVAWVDDGGRAVLYIDGEPDPADFGYERRLIQVARTGFGCVPGPEVLSPFAGGIDEVRLYNYALDAEEIRELAGSASASRFHRGDADADGELTIADAVFLLQFLFRGGAEPGCLDAADTNDDAALDITDAVAVLRYLFLGGVPPAPPGPPGSPCGVDPGGGAGPGCRSYPPCAP